jgi:NADH:ubiquinone oxidoreductase subunit 6 (subunit J)
MLVKNINKLISSLTSSYFKLKQITIKHSISPWLRLIIVLLLHILFLPMVFLGLLFVLYMFTSISTYEIGLNLLYFFYFLSSINLYSAGIICFSFLVFKLKNPVYCLVNLILLFLTTALFLISIQVEFLAMIYIIIYIGAIAILFLFVIMMFNLRDSQYRIKKVKDDDFISISFSIYLFLLAKFYKICTVAFLQYLEDDYYINKTKSIFYN